ncbi:MAG TPA: hypothetical protein VNK24_07475, partial [Elusimicrobiota bacterium]|nr:hypothetical protein [Elusimicrobiota bacterium]
RITSVSSATISGVAPGGTAGGALSGSYPNPGLAASQSAAVTWSGAQTFSSGANFPNSGIWNSTGIGIGTSPNAELDIKGSSEYEINTGNASYVQLQAGSVAVARVYAN